MSNPHMVRLDTDTLLNASPDELAAMFRKNDAALNKGEPGKAKKESASDKPLGDSVVSGSYADLNISDDDLGDVDLDADDISYLQGLGDSVVNAKVPKPSRDGGGAAVDASHDPLDDSLSTPNLKKRYALVAAAQAAQKEGADGKDS